VYPAFACADLEVVFFAIRKEAFIDESDAFKKLQTEPSWPCHNVHRSCTTRTLSTLPERHKAGIAISRSRRWFDNLEPMMPIRGRRV